MQASTADGCGGVDEAVVVNVGVADATLSTFQLYPNPADESITVVTPFPAVVTLRNALGERVRVQAVIGTGTVDVSDLPVGVFNYGFAFADGSVRRGTFVVQR